MDITNEEAVWAMLTADVTVLDLNGRVVLNNRIVKITMAAST